MSGCTRRRPCLFWKKLNTNGKSVSWVKKFSRFSKPPKKLPSSRKPSSLRMAVQSMWPLKGVSPNGFWPWPWVGWHGGSQQPVHAMCVFTKKGTMGCISEWLRIWSQLFFKISKRRTCLGVRNTVWQPVTRCWELFQSVSVPFYRPCLWDDLGLAMDHNHWKFWTCLEHGTQSRTAGTLPLGSIFYMVCWHFGLSLL